jgi:ABC-type antimicrobial peptide transport system permease subunit
MLIELIKEALTTLKKNVLRTILTMIGIVLGVGAVVTIMTLGKSAYATVEKTIYGSGAGNIDIHHSGVEGAQAVPFDDSFRSLLEAAKIEEIIGYDYAMNDYKTLALNSNDDSIETIFFYRRAGDLGELKYLAGRAFEGVEVELKSQVAVVDKVLAEKLFGVAGDAVGESLVTSNGFFYRIVGVVETERGVANDGGKIGLAYIPLSLAELLPSFQVRGYDGLVAKVKVGANYKKVTDRIEAYLMEVFGFVEKKEMTISLGSINQMMEQISSMMRVFSIGLSLIAAISLLVGGVGIMNIMLVSVTERTKEIGLMKALGARDGDVVFQFLVESVVMTVFGGMLGVILGLGVSGLVVKLANTFGGDNLPKFLFVMDGWSIVVSMAVSVAIGLIFGAYPASRAAKLRPVEALRRD